MKKYVFRTVLALSAALLLAACGPSEEEKARLPEIEKQLLWDTRIYDARQQSMTAVCESPVLLEQRVFALALRVAALAAGAYSQRTYGSGVSWVGCCVQPSVFFGYLPARGAGSGQCVPDNQKLALSLAFFLCANHAQRGIH